jgi:hypothetical protein
MSRIDPPLFNQDPLRRKIIIALPMSSVAEHLKQAIHFENRAALFPIFDTERPIRATGDMLLWYTGKACEHVNHLPYQYGRIRHSMGSKRSLWA